MRVLLPAFIWALSSTFALSVVVPESASAEPPQAGAKKKGKKKKRGKKGREASAANSAAPAAPETSTPAPARESGPAPKSAQELARAAAQDSAAGADAQIVKEGDTSVKVMSFTGLDIEGRLKSPQLLYFVNRVHAEFERPKLPHRSFMPELDRSTQRDPLR
jgi:hypothetical protein